MSYGILVKAFKCQICLTNTKLFSWESEANLETLQKVSLYIWVSYKFVLKSVKSLNRIFWATEYWFKAFKCQIWLRNAKPFYWVSEANIETLQKLSLPILKLLTNLFRSLGKISMGCDYCFFEFFECWIFNCQIFNWRLCNCSCSLQLII